MTLSRRGFIKLSAAAALSTAFTGLGLAAKLQAAKAATDRIKQLTPEWSRQTTSVCCFCAVGCGLIVNTALAGTKRALNVEGDPEHPTNEGALCPKGGSIWQLAESTPRVQKVMYRKPGGAKFEPKSWDWALTQIAKRVKRDRDAAFELKNAKGQVVNRCESIAHVGSAALDNEECWVLQAFMRSLGLTYIEHQARICHSSTVPALAESFGRGAMTNHWLDLQNSDVILMMGSNPAENHPISFKHVTRCKQAGGKLIHVDPRFSRTSAKADLYAPLRSGTDIAFLGGMINQPVETNTTSTEITLTTSIPKPLTSENDVYLFPNPATENLAIIASFQNSEIEITDMEGRCVKFIKAIKNKTIIDISNLAKGMYLMKVKTDAGIKTKKFIKE